MSDFGGIPAEHFNRIRSLVDNFPHVQEVVLFGSRAKGTFREGSDIDLALKGKSITTTDLALLQDAYDELYLPWKLDLVIYDKIENQELKDHIDRVGQVVG